MSIEEKLKAALQELRNISIAKRHDRDLFVDDAEFADWAQSRARHTLREIEDEQ